LVGTPTSKLIVIECLNGTVLSRGIVTGVGFVFDSAPTAGTITEVDSLVSTRTDFVSEFTVTGLNVDDLQTQSAIHSADCNDDVTKRV